VQSTYAVITELREKLSAGATADVLVLPTPVLDRLENDGKVCADSRTTFGTVGDRLRRGGYHRQCSTERRVRLREIYDRPRKPPCLEGEPF
jgi:hypothetical protein